MNLVMAITVLWTNRGNNNLVPHHSYNPFVCEAWP
jgi:hypothetical protein